MAGAASASPTTTLKMPAGKPARCPSSAKARAVSGVASAGFTTTVQPTANAGAHLRVIMAAGKFQGVMAAATPMASRNTNSSRSTLGEGMISPYARRASSANHSTKLAAYKTSPLASAKGLPCSRVMSMARSSALARMSPCQALSTATRALVDRARQAGKAAAAASTASRASCAPMLATCAIASPEAGSVTGNRRLDTAPRQAPAIKPSEHKSEGSFRTMAMAVLTSSWA